MFSFFSFQLSKASKAQQGKQYAVQAALESTIAKELRAPGRKVVSQSASHSTSVTGTLFTAVVGVPGPKDGKAYPTVFRMLTNQ